MFCDHPHNFRAVMQSTKSNCSMAIMTSNTLNTLRYLGICAQIQSRKSHAARSCTNNEWIIPSTIIMSYILIPRKSLYITKRTLSFIESTTWKTRIEGAIHSEKSYHLKRLGLKKANDNEIKTWIWLLPAPPVRGHGLILLQFHLQKPCYDFSFLWVSWITNRSLTSKDVGSNLNS